MARITGKRKQVTGKGKSTSFKKKPVARAKKNEPCADLVEFENHRSEFREHLEGHEAWTKSMSQEMKDIKADGKTLRKALDIHVDDEIKTWERVTGHIKDVEGKVDNVAYKIDNVKVNGKRGLTESMQDIYSKLDELHKLTESTRATKNLKSAVKNWFSKSPMFSIFKTKIGAIFGVIIVILIVNTVLASFDIGFDLVVLGKFFLSLFGAKF